MGSATPWWGTVVVALVSVASMLIAQWMTNLRERRRTEAEQYQMILERRSAAYADCLRSARRLLSLRDWQSAEDRAAALDKFHTDAAAVQLIASDAVRAEVTTTVSAVERLARVAPGSPRDSAPVAEAAEDVEAAVRAVTDAMRTELGIPTPARSG